MLFLVVASCLFLAHAQVTPRWSRHPDAQISLAAVGDTMIGTTFPWDRTRPDADKFFDPVKAFIQEADVGFINVEGVLQNKDSEQRKRCSNPKQCYLFRSPKSYAKIFKEAGFNVASLANNHARDFINGIPESTAVLEAEGIAVSGGPSQQASFTVNGLKIKLLAVGFNPGLINYRDIPNVAQMVRDAKETHDQVWVSFHGGAEGTKATHVTKKTEWGFGENRGNPYKFSRAMIDAGADIILGHGPHVVRGVELYKNRLIAYSLGNFATWLGISVSGIKGIAPILRVDLAADGSFLAGKLVSTKQGRGKIPLKLDSTHTAAKMIRDLTNADFNGGGLTILDDGTLLKAE